MDVFFLWSTRQNPLGNKDWVDDFGRPVEFSVVKYVFFCRREEEKAARGRKEIGEKMRLVAAMEKAEGRKSAALREELGHVTEMLRKAENETERLRAR